MRKGQQLLSTSPHCSFFPFLLYSFQYGSIIRILLVQNQKKYTQRSLRTGFQCISWGYVTREILSVYFDDVFISYFSLANYTIHAAHHFSSIPRRSGFMNPAAAGFVFGSAAMFSARINSRELCTFCVARFITLKIEVQVNLSK